MAIRFTINGIQFEADTAAEALEMATKYQGGGRGTERTSSAKSRPSANGDGAETGDKYAAFLAKLKDSGRRVVQAIAKHGKDMTTDELSRESGFSTLSLPPVIRHIYTTARNAGLDPDKVLARRDIMDGESPKSAYRLDEEVAKRLK